MDRPHVVLLPLPNAQGHIIPMMQLAKRLAASDVLVTFITIEYSLARLRSAANQSSSSDSGGESVRFIGVPDGLPPESDRHVMSAEYVGMLDRVSLETEAQLKQLMDDPHVPPVTCVVGDVFLDCVRSIVKTLGLPRCAFWPMSATILNIHKLYRTFKANGYDPLEREVPPFSVTDEEAIIRCIPGVPKLPKSYFPYYTGLGDVVLSATLAWLSNTISNLDECVCTLGNTVLQLEPEQCTSLGEGFLPIGPLAPLSFLPTKACEDQVDQEQQNSTGASFWKEEYIQCMEWLNKREDNSVVYVSFGSLARFTKEQVGAIGEALMTSKYHFLWVIRKDTILDVPVASIYEALPVDFHEATKDRVMIVQWAPQLAVLDHKAVGVFLSHCGWNSILESILMGVPILAWPQYVDQVTNCWMLVHEWQLGLELKRDQRNIPDAQEVEKSLQSIMEGSQARSIQAKASSLKEISRQHISHGTGTSYKNLEVFIEMLYKMMPSTKPPNGNMLVP